MSTCSGCDKPAMATVDLGTATLCDECIRRECMREHPPVDRRPWLAVRVGRTTTTTSKDDFAA